MAVAERRLPHNCYELQARRTPPQGPTHESSSCIHTDVPCGHGEQTCDVAIFAQTEARLSIPLSFATVGPQQCRFPQPKIRNGTVTSMFPMTAGSQRLNAMPFGLRRILVHGSTRAEAGGCSLAQRARHNARHALAIGRGLSRPIDVSRLLQRAPPAAVEE